MVFGVLHVVSQLQQFIARSYFHYFLLMELDIFLVKPMLNKTLRPLTLELAGCQQGHWATEKPCFPDAGFREGSGRELGSSVLATWSTSWVLLGSRARFNRNETRELNDRVSGCGQGPRFLMGALL